jgi:hypothetical protein
MSLLKPSEYKTKIEDIALDRLFSDGKRALIIDLEGTIVPKEKWELSASKTKWLAHARSLGFKVCFLSNTFFGRKSQAIADKLRVPIISAALKPMPFGFFRALSRLNEKAGNSVMIGDQLFMDILGANILGIYTILVDPITGEKNFFRKLMRQLERRILGPKT